MFLEKAANISYIVYDGSYQIYHMTLKDSYDIFDMNCLLKAKNMMNITRTTPTGLADMKGKVFHIASASK